MFTEESIFSRFSDDDIPTCVFWIFSVLIKYAKSVYVILSNAEQSSTVIFIENISACIEHPTANDVVDVSIKFKIFFCHHKFSLSLSEYSFAISSTAFRKKKTKKMLWMNVIGYSTVKKRLESTFLLWCIEKFKFIVHICRFNI